MQRRYETVNGRPSGTDGSDFSYRMVVDSRYTKVAKGKSRLSKLIFAQAILQFIGALNLFLSKPEEKLDSLAVSPTVLCFISLMIGEIGRKRSKANFLKFYVFGSSIATLISIICLARSTLILEVIKDSRAWEAKKFELFKAVATLLGFLVQICTVGTTISLVHNMAPPKRAS